MVVLGDVGGYGGREAWTCTSWLAEGSKTLERENVWSFFSGTISTIFTNIFLS